MPLRKMGRKWQYRFSVRGQNVCVTTDLEATERNRTAALVKEAAHRQAIEEGRWGFRPLKPRSFTDALVEFKEWVKIEYQAKPNTWKRILTSMSTCSVFFEKKMISAIHPGDVERYKVWRLSGQVGVVPVKDVTAKHDLDNLSIFFQWGVKAGYARQNPVKEVKRPSDAAAIRERILTPAEEKLYFAHAKGNLWKVARLMLLQGMRPEEVMRIRREDVDLEKGTLRVMFGKTPAARRTLKLTQEARSILAAQMDLVARGKLVDEVNPRRRRVNGGMLKLLDRTVTASAHGSIEPAISKSGEATSNISPWIFPSPKKPGAHIQKLNCPHDRVCRKIKLTFCLYDLRHTFATRMVEAGVDILTLAGIMGHSKIAITQRYCHISQAHKDTAMAVYDTLNEQRRKAEVVQ